MQELNFIVCQRNDNTEAFIIVDEIAAVDEISSDNDDYTIIILKSGNEIKVEDSATDIFTSISKVVQNPRGIFVGK